MSTVKETAAAQARAPGPKPGPGPDAKNDLKSLPVAEVEKRLGSSPEGLSQAEAAGSWRSTGRMRSRRRRTIRC
jgi:H+-transporting ATPase